MNLEYTCTTVKNRPAIVGSFNIIFIMSNHHTVSIIMLTDDELDDDEKNIK